MTFVESRPEEAPAAGERSGWSTAAAGRSWLAGAEVLVAGALGYAARWSWGNASVPIELGVSEIGLDTVTRSLGNWLTIGIVLGTLSGLLLVDAVRRLLQLWLVGKRY